MRKDTDIRWYLKRYHRGREKAVHSAELERIFDIKKRDLQRVISSLRKNGEPICSGEMGYYYAKDQQEINQMIRKFGSYAHAFSHVKENMLYSSLTLVKEAVNQKSTYRV